MSCARYQSRRLIADSRARSVFGSVLACLPVFLAGCQASLPTRANAPTPPRGNAELMEFLSNQSVVCAEPAYRAVYMLWTGDAFDGEFEALRDRFIEEKIAVRSWKHAPNTIMNRAGVAYMVCKACDIKAGANWLVSDLGRYAWKQLQSMGIAGRGTEVGYFSGGEFLGLISRADEYVYKKRNDAERRPELGDEP